MSKLKILRTFFPFLAVVEASAVVLIGRALLVVVLVVLVPQILWLGSVLIGVVRTKAEADGTTARVRTTMAAICKVDEDLLVIIIVLVSILSL
jgi:hypothetical protein